MDRWRAEHALAREIRSRMVCPDQKGNAMAGDILLQACLPDVLLELLQERNAHTTLGEVLHQPPQVVEVAGQVIHAVDHHHIALAHEGEQRCQR